MLSQLLSGNFSVQTIIAEIMAVLLIIFLILPFHEWAHAQTAYLLGDKGIKQRGRLSLNPLSHIDPVGALAMLLIGFGWAKPVPVDSRYFKNPKVGMAITALMGPVANLVAALAGLFTFHIIWCIAPSFFTAGGFGSYVLAFLQFYIVVNVNLAVFNLHPYNDSSHRALVDRSAELYPLIPVARSALRGLSVLNAAVPAFRTEHSAV